MYKKVLIVCASVHHNNTFKVANVIREELDAKIIKPNEVSLEIISEYDLIGFGSGIYNRKHHNSIFKLIDELEVQQHKDAVIFSTSTVPFKAIHKELRRRLSEKGFNVIEEFACKGFMDYSFTKYFGGLNKGRPNDEDLRIACEFARVIKNKGY